MSGNNIKFEPALKLQYPVYDLDGQLLLPSGTKLSSDSLNYLISLNKPLTYQKYPLLQFIKKDLQLLLKRPPYNVIFTDKHLVEILSLYEEISIDLPVLQILDFFKKYDHFTYHHVLSSFALTTLLAIDLIPDYQDVIRELGVCPAHDIGKICVPVHIIKKSDPLTPEELRFLRHHTLAGYVLLCYYFRDTSNLAAIVARDHHERRNGAGYPYGKSLTDHIVEIVAVSDVYDALISDRPYRPTAYDNRTALEVITEMAKKGEISWDIVSALVSYNRKNRPHFQDCTVSTEKRGAAPQGNVYGVIKEK
jgi:HD-GYP domain-containing protein (c-di-GMP phosphodiesterase class II)